MNWELACALARLDSMEAHNIVKKGFDTPEEHRLFMDLYRLW